MKSLGWVTGAILIGLLSLSASACSFAFSYDAIEAPIGTVGEIGIQVQKTHNKCTLPSMEEYDIDAAGIQVLGETDWQDKGGGLYEKWVQVSLSTFGQGSLTISKTCAKEGYEEKVLPISTAAATDDSLWTQAWNGTYPFEAAGVVDQVAGSLTVQDGTIAVGAETVPLPVGAILPEMLPETARLYTQMVGARRVPLLLVGEGIFIRFDQFLI